MKDIAAQLDGLARLFKTIGSHLVIIIILLGLSAIGYAIYSINQVIAMPDDENYRNIKQSQSVKIRFDQDTINKLERLRARQEQMTTDLPGGRINPFVE